MTNAEPPGRMRRRCCLYRHFDADDVLLYVGISNDPGYRTFEHSVGAGRRWVNYALRMEGVWYASTEAARAAERVAIRNEAPIYNTNGRSTQAESEARKAAYERTHVPLAVPGEEVRPRRTRDEVAEALRAMITSGELPPGEPMKTITLVAREYDVGQDTALNVLELLLREGWLEKPKFRGRWYVTSALPPVPPSPEHYQAVTRGDGYVSPQTIITKRIRSQIESGELEPGRQLPSFAEIAESGNASIGTVQRVIDTLRTEGLVVTRKGSGTFVAERVVDEQTAA